MSGNNFFSGYGSHHVRARLAGALKGFFVECIKKSNLKPIKNSDYPVKITWEIGCPRGIANWDLDNLWFYKKFFIDALRECRILKKDTITYITDLGGPTWFPVATDKDRYFIFTIEPDKRKLK